MSTMKKMISKTVNKVSAMLDPAGLSQETGTGADAGYCNEGMDKLIRTAGAEGCVLLKNDGALPLKKSDKVAVFGRCQYNYFCVGYGSGGDVNAPYKVNLIDGMRNCQIDIYEDLASYYQAWCEKKSNVPDEGFWGNWPMNYDEMPLKREIVTLASTQCNKAVVVIGRAAGEDRENKLIEGSYYLTKIEKQNIDLICSKFDKVIVVMDCGNLIDMAWTEEYGDKISAILFAGQGGQESGNAVADILCGNVNPSGKLADTIGRYYEDYPSSKDFGGKEYNEYSEDIFVGYRYFETFAKDKVIYPFGFGLSYTNFSIEVIKTETLKNGKFKIEVSVTNTGNVDGKEVVQLYVKAPQGKLGKPARSLVAFEKTKLLKPGKSQKLSFSVSDYAIASYDDEGETGHKSAYVLEEGEYIFYIGNSVRTETVAGKITVDETKVIEELSEVCSVENTFFRLKAREENGEVKEYYELLRDGERSLKERILQNLPKTIGYKGDKGYKLSQVKSGEISLEDFVSQLTGEELESISRGHGIMNSYYAQTPKNGGSFGGIHPSLRYYGIPAVITCDGPSGLRVNKTASLLPCGTTLAFTWNKKLVEELYKGIAKEMEYHKIDVFLGPGLNIHRNPLCGRNFEYYSEDPVISGEMAAAAVKGIQSLGGSACVKHFACNNQEVCRNRNDSRVSERALREIYLKGFEIAVKEASPKVIMTSYNKINGVWSHYNYDLATTVLRGEWGFDGVAITDWWMQKAVSPEFPFICDNAYRIRAQVDVLMPGNMDRMKKDYADNGNTLTSLDQPGGLSRGELERGAMNILRYIIANKM